MQTADTDPERIVGGAMAMQLVPQPPQSWDTCHDAGAPPMPWPPMPWGSTDAGGGCRTIMVPRSDRFVAQFVVAGPLVLTDASLSGYFERLTLFTVPTGSKCGAPDGLSIPPEAEMLGDVPMNGMHGARYLVKVGHSLCCLGSGAVMFVSDGGANPALKLVWSGFVPY